jgi:hypothetical protein
MSVRLPSEFLIKALIRRVHDAGGSAAVLARGDRQGGAILVLGREPNGDVGYFERGWDPNGRVTLVPTGPTNREEIESSAYWQRRVSRDRDLWVIELCIPDSQRFAAETIAMI